MTGDALLWSTDNQHTQKQLGSAPSIQLLLREGQLTMCPRSDYKVVGVFEE